MRDTSIREATRLPVVAASNPSLSSPPLVVRRSRVFLAPTMVAGFRLATCAHCSGVVDLVWYGDISVRDGVARLVVLRQGGTPEQSTSSVAALQFLARCSDAWIASATRSVLHERLVEESWLLFTQYRDAMAQARLEYEEVVTATLRHVVAREVSSSLQIPVPSEVVPDHADDVDADSLESF